MYRDSAKTSTSCAEYSEAGPPQCPCFQQVVTWTGTQNFQVEVAADVGDVGHLIPSVYQV